MIQCLEQSQCGCRSGDCRTVTETTFTSRRNVKTSALKRRRNATKTKWTWIDQKCQTMQAVMFGNYKLLYCHHGMRVRKNTQTHEQCGSKGTQRWCKTERMGTLMPRDARINRQGSFADKKKDLLQIVWDSSVGRYIDVNIGISIFLKYRQHRCISIFFSNYFKFFRKNFVEISL